MQKNQYLLAAEAAAKAAGKIIKHYHQKGFTTQIKADGSPVTQADQEAERAIRQILQSRFPEHGFYGEEYGQENAHAEYLWLIDPIDGTKSFVRGTPYFSTQIALWHGGETIVAVSNAPAVAETLVAQKGAGVEFNGEPVRCSRVTTLADCVLSTGNIKRLAADAPAWASLGKLIGELNRVRGYGDFSHYHFLAKGALDLVIESEVNILDIAALSLIVQEAGGVFTDLDGQPIDLQTTTVLAAANRDLYQQVFDRLAPARVALFAR